MPMLEKLMAKELPSPNYRRLFYPGVSVLLLILMFLGFRQFYLYGKAYPGRELAPPIRTLLILHGIGMTSWMVLFVAQPLLILAGNRRVHRLLGRIGAGLAAVMVVLSFRLGIESTLLSPPDLRIWGLASKQFLAVPIISILIFSGFVILGVSKRRQPEVHRSMMLLATLAVMSAAVSRIDFLNSLYQGTIWEAVFGPFFTTLAIGALFLAVKWLPTRSLNPWLVWGYGGLVLSDALIMQLATTGVWDLFATFLLQ
ncbi:hypothetical protein [Methylosarcina fibrata]|uniref:hypothetical protein n=1 Tax=Methylosarcina fibrata TaxID=105972 RepID=UPI0003A36310|nr:hypothetical protein [Methylosarcina fibrata]